MLPLIRSPWNKTIYVFAFALLSCAHGQKNVLSKDQANAKVLRPAPLSRLNFCEQIGKDISSIGEGFECLASPNWIESGVYGPKSFPNESTLEGQFGHLPEYVFSKSQSPFSTSLKATERETTILIPQLRHAVAPTQSASIREEQQILSLIV